MQYLVRLISSEQHHISRDELMRRIRETGSDRYDPNKDQIFPDFYGKYDVDFFAMPCEGDNLDNVISQMAQEFPAKTMGDRGESVHPDIAIVYDATQCEMIKNVYDELETSDCYSFRHDPKHALVEVRAL